MTIGIEISKAFEVLTRLESLSGRNDKIKTLKEHQDNEILRKILFLAYSGEKFHVHLEYTGESETVAVDDYSLLEANYTRFLELLDLLKTRQVTGKAAVGKVEAFYEAISPLEKKWYYRVMEHDLRIGMTDNSITKVLGKDFWGDTRTDKNSYGYLEVMLSEKWEKKKSKFVGIPLYIEPKFDGYRLAAVIDKGQVTFYSRGGKSQPYTDNLGHVAEQLLEAGFDNCMVDAEIVKDTWNGTGIVKKLREGMTEAELENLHKVKFLCFDYINLTKLTDKSLYAVAFEERRKQLEGFFGGKEFKNIALVESKVVLDEDEIREEHSKHRKAGHEGSMIKNPKGFYEFGVSNKRSIQWLKIKPVHTIDGKIIGFEPGKSTGKNSQRLGALVVRDSKGTIYRCGQGISDDDRDYIYDNREELLGSIVEMEAQDETNGKAVASARNAVFVRLRPDRDGVL